jgi:hypothetical protein
VNLLEPWVFFRLVAGLIACLCFCHAAWVGLRVIRYFHLRSTAEGQLSLERQAELGAASARVGAGVQVGALLLTVLSADQLSASVKGAMCGYGVVHADPAGPMSVGATVLAALGAGVLLQLLELDARTRSLAMIRPIAWGAIGLAVLSLADLGLALSWLGSLDFSVVASCCSSGLDAAVGGSDPGGTLGSKGDARQAVVALGLALVPLSAAVALLASRRPRGRGMVRARGLAIASGALSALALPITFAAAALEVAPHVYEVPHHRCPYCLFRIDAGYLGYPLFGAALLAAIWSIGAAVAALVAPRSPVAPASPPSPGAPAAHAPLAPAGSDADPFDAFASRALRLAGIAWLCAGALCAAPVVRYAIVTGGASLFP